MNRPSIVVLALGALLVTASAVGQPTPKDPGGEAPDADAAKAAKLMRDAIRVGNDGDWKKARTMLEEAFSIKPTFDIAANLSLAEENTGDLGLAGDHLAYAIRMFPVVGKPEHKKTLQERYEALTKRVGRLTLRSNEAGAKIFVDERPRGQTPTADALHLEPGHHTIRLEKQGYIAQSRPSEAVAGGQASMAVQLERDPNAGLPPAPTATPSGSVIVPPSGSTVPPDKGKPAWPAVLMGTTGGVALAAGIVFVAVGLGKDGDLEAVRCPGNAASCPDEAHDQLSERNTLVGLSIGAFVLAGAAAVSTTLYLAIPVADDGKAAVRLAPGGVILEGSF